MTKKDLIDYILDTPQNVNPAILNQMLDEVGGGGASEGEYDFRGADYIEIKNNTILGASIDLISSHLPHLINFGDGYQTFSFVLLSYGDPLGDGKYGLVNYQEGRNSRDAADLRIILHNKVVLDISEMSSEFYYDEQTDSYTMNSSPK